MGRISKRCLLPVMIFFLCAVPSVFCQESFPELVKIEADYILRCQASDPEDPSYGAINRRAGRPECVVPAENALAILGLLKAEEIYPGNGYAQNAVSTAAYLVRVQDADGAWYNQYHWTEPGDLAGSEQSLSKSPYQTAMVVIGLYNAGFDSERYSAVKKAALYLISCQGRGGNGLLVGGGKDASGNYSAYRFSSDNAAAYQALKAAETWALTAGEIRNALYYSRAARRILEGIDGILYVADKSDPDFGVWRRCVDGSDMPVEPGFHDWLNYCPQLFDVPARGVNEPVVGDWIYRTLRDGSGACFRDDSGGRYRLSPSASFKASLCWMDTGRAEYMIDALNWALDSGLWLTGPVCDAVAGGWLDWKTSGVESSQTSADCADRFIESSFYAISAYNGGYDFNVVPGYLRVSYSGSAQDSPDISYYLQFRFPSDCRGVQQ